ncbi:WecB/TagA/CpsF family glycosyltransferase [Photobacterium kishitanii]|uniref:WecB/TagA/CpsF family glycosyltransferase n=1 Tax=Photobacterium kishitanii TaxID=318456 RepID=UPI002739F1E5|nr:WecB/TagA/CpsF family glycosyltransferase [Photobacterium kishitanii]
MKKIKRVSFDFSSVANMLFESADKLKFKIALVGGNFEENKSCLEYLSEKYTNIDFSLSRHGFFDTDYEREKYILELKDKNVDIIISGMGTPLQEDFLLETYFKTHATLFITCGGFITQTGISKGEYYWPIINKLGLRWLQRFILHSHVRNRLIKVYPSFVINYLLKGVRK